MQKKTPLAIRKRDPRFLTLAEKPLTMHQELFCNFYVKNEWARGNATRSYARAYYPNIDNLSKEAMWSEADPETGVKTLIKQSDSSKAWECCEASGPRMLGNVRVNERISQLLLEYVDNDVADMRLKHWMMQDHEPRVSLEAIKHYNDLKKRIDKNSEVSHFHFFLDLAKKAHQEVTEELKKEQNGGN